MVKWLKFSYITMTIIFLTGCVSVDDKQRRSQNVIELNDITSHKSDCDSKAEQFDLLKRECIMSRDLNCVTKLERLAFEMHQDANFLSGKAIYSNYHDFENMAYTATMICGQHACRTTLETADVYFSLGDKENAKRLYREVITTFTGTAYAGFVKKAEFALEDLKAVQRK